MDRYETAGISPPMKEMRKAMQSLVHLDMAAPSG
jgi:hypothetical protein